ncbi:uncharacterized protein LOC121247346 [Juglans microcarpa x Juglans regia]|uniref:uncharacterized protein LOC121247346 n=1 Tax=Juglans microcarpa x Juglans regia TaxID=2249226 RepID=UPI001B7F25D4|nr:uncharacterized protein LOC121247346 [Juglans microcarpa x Juglans regia]
MDESVCHALWSCCGANDVWACKRSPVQKWPSCEREMFKLWSDWSTKLAKDQLEIMVVVLRRVWLRRNGVVFENSFVDPSVFFNQVVECLLDFQQAQCRQGSGQSYGVQISKATRWKSPVGETIKVNWDAAWRVNDYRCGIGVVIRDSCGEVLASLCCPKQNVVDPVVAEIYALWRAMKFCEELKFSMVQLEGDALSVVQAVNKEEASWE